MLPALFPTLLAALPAGPGAALAVTAAALTYVIDLSRCPKRNFMRQVTQNLTKSGAEVGLGDTSS